MRIEFDIQEFMEFIGYIKTDEAVNTDLVNDYELKSTFQDKIIDLTEQIYELSENNLTLANKIAKLEEKSDKNNENDLE